MPLPERSSSTKVTPPDVPTPGMAGGGNAKPTAPGILANSPVQVRLDRRVLLLRLLALAPIPRSVMKKKAL